MEKKLDYVTSSRRRYIMMILAIVECALFGYLTGGWPSLVYIFKSDGLFTYKCSSASLPSISYNASYVGISGADTGGLGIKKSLMNILYNGSTTTPISSHPQECTAQSQALNNVYLVSNFLGIVGTFGLGCFFDKFGLVISRSLATVCFLVQILMLSFNNVAYSWLLYPGLIAGGFASTLIMICATHVALVVGELQHLQVAFLGVLTAAISASSFVAAVIQHAYDAGYSRSQCFYVYGSLWGIHLINTIFVSPRFKISPGSTEEMDQNTENGSDVLTSSTDMSDLDDWTSEDEDIEILPFRKYACSPLFILLTVWFSAMTLCFSYIMGIYNSWLNAITGGDAEEVGRLSMRFTYMQLLSVPLAPLVGLLTSGQRQIPTTKEKTPLVQPRSDSDIAWQRALIFLPDLVVSIMTAVCLSASVMFMTNGATWASSILMAIFKLTFYTTYFAFIQIVYPFEHYGKACGLVYSLACIVSLLELVLFKWAVEASEPFTGANTTILVLCCLTIVFPLTIIAKQA